VTDKRFVIYLLVFLCLTPLGTLPFIGHDLWIAYEEMTRDDRNVRVRTSSDPVRLVTVPLISSTFGMRDAMVAVIDLPTRDDADALCEQAPYLNDELQTFAAEHPSRTNSKRRIPGRDPTLAKALAQRFPAIKMNAVRLTEPTAYGELYPSRDVYECHGLSNRRIAMKSYK